MATHGKTGRRSVDLSGYPDLIVIYLGFRVTRLRGIAVLAGLGSGIKDAVAGKPDGLLAHESVLYSLRHIGMRQYWRDMESLEAFTRSEPHKTWWRKFSKQNENAGFWHETYRRAGGMEAIYLGLDKPIGFALFAPERAPVGPFMSARERLA